MNEQPAPSLSENVKTFANQIGTLARLDLAMLKAETTSHIRSFLLTGLLVAIAFLCGLFALAFLSVAAFFEMVSTGLQPTMAAAAIAVFFFCLALLVASIAIYRSRRASFTPVRTINQMRGDLQALKASLAGGTNGL